MTEATITAQTIVNTLAKLLKEEGSLLLAAIPDRLKPIDYKQFSGGKGLKSWLLGFPEFEASEDGLSLILTGAPQPAPKASPANSDIAAEVRCMHTFSYMNYWNQNLKQMRTLGDFGDMKAELLRDQIAHVLMYNLFSGGLEIDSTNAQSPQLILDTGYVLPSGHPMYAVFGLNPINTDGTKQFWMMKGFCSTAEQDASELGSWLRSYYSGRFAYDYSDLTGQIKRIGEMTAQLQGGLSLFQESLDTGSCPALEDGKRFSQHVSEYEQLWEELTRILATFPALSATGPLTLAGLQQMTTQESIRSGLMRKALEAFDRLSSGLHGFFIQNLWTSNEDTAPLQDGKLLRQHYERGTVADPALTEFRRVLDIYRCFLQVVSTCEPDDAYYENVAKLRAHFEGLQKISLRTASLLLANVPEEERLFLNEIDGIYALLDQYAASGAEVPSREEVSTLPDTNSELLQLALEETKQYQTDWPRHMRSALPEEPGLREVVLKASDADTMTCFDVAIRLLKVKETMYAERYLILGLLYESERCAPSLLRLYRDRGQTEAFEAVWQKYHALMNVSQEDEIFRFGILCDRAPAQALEMAQKRMHLQYQSASLAKLVTVANALGDTALEEVYRSRLAALQAHSEPDKLEGAIIHSNWPAVTELLEEAELTPDQLQRLRSVLESGDYPTGSGAYATGMRLYAFLGNRNGCAEQWLWKGLPGQGRGSFAALMQLLTEEERWDEAICLYEANRESQRQFEESRRLYLLASYSQSPERAQPLFVENLYDALTMILMPGAAEKFRVAAQEPNGVFYARLLALHEAVSSPYLWSVVCEDRSLRERVCDQVQLDSLGLDAAAISEIYRTGLYSHGRDAASIAERLYALAGNLSAAAELAAQLAGDQASAQRLLWSIYSDEGNEPAMYALLDRSEVLRQEHEAQYIGFVYAREEYERYLALLSQWQEIGARDRIRRATAELVLRKPVTDLPETCAEAAHSCTAEDCEKLLALAAAGHDELAIEIIYGCFDKWLTEIPDQLRSLVSCSGTASEHLLKKLQEKALANNVLTLAVYLQNVLKVGNVSAQAELLYDSLQAQLQTETAEEALLCLQKLQYIYPEQAANISAQAARTSIQMLLDSRQTAGNTDITAELEAIILSLDRTPELFAAVTGLLEEAEYCPDHQVYTAIYNYGKESGCSTEALLFLHRAGKTGATAQNGYFRDNLVKYYYNALLGGHFPVQIAEEAEQLCLQVLEKSDSMQAALSVCMLELLLSRPIRAKAVLNHLQTITASLYSTLQEALLALGIEEDSPLTELAEALPNHLELFEQVLERGSEQAVTEHLNFCRRFTKVNPGALQALRNLRAGEDLSEAHSIQAVELLCSDPGNAEYWSICARILFDVEDMGRAVFLSLCCQKNPSCWKEYVQLCENLTEAPERLPAALSAWAAAPNSQAFREYIEDKLEQQPAYLEQLSDPVSLCRMTEALCRPLKEAGLNVGHAQLGTVALIAVSTGDPDCLKILQRDAGHALFGSKCDLGVVVLSKLLLASRFEEAQEWLSNLKNSVAAAKYRALIDELAGFDAEGLRKWCDEPSSEHFLKLIPHDGNQPNMERIAKTVTPVFFSGKEKEMAEALVQLLRIFPDDYAASHELFELCKTGFEGYLPLMHFSLLNLCRVAAASENPQQFDDRPQESHTVALAILNQLLISTHQTPLVTDGWNFEYSTAQGLEHAGVIVSDPALLSSTEQLLEDSLEHQQLEVSALRKKAWLATITGNWTEYLQDVYNAGHRPPKVFFPQNDVDNAGVTASVLLLLHQTPVDAHPELLAWLKQLAKASREKGNQILLAVKLAEEGMLSRFQEIAKHQTSLVLRFPADNSRLFRCLADKTLEPALNKGLTYAEPIARILCAISGNRWGMFTLYAKAEDRFKKGQDDLAWMLYSALHEARLGHNVSHGHSAREKRTAETGNTPYRYNREEYEAKMRISGAFIGKEQFVKKLNEPDLNPWSLINLVLCMAASRPDEIWRLEAYMDPQRAYMAEHVRTILDPGTEDEVKIQCINDPQLAAMDRYYLAKLLGSGDYQNFLKHSQRSRGAVTQVYTGLYKSFAAAERKHCNKPLLCKAVGLFAVGAKLQAQKDPSLWEIVRIAPEASKRHTYTAPEYAAHLAPLETDSQTLQDLLQQYRNLETPRTHAGYCERAKLSEELYRRTLGAGESVDACYCALLRYSVDRFYDLISDGTQSSKEQAYRLLISLLETDSSNIHSGEEYTALTELVNVVGVAGLFKSYTQIRPLCEAYANCERAFIKLKGLLRDDYVFESVSVIYDVLKELNTAFSLFSSSDVTKVIQALQDADTSIGSINTISISSVKGHLQRLIRTELSSLSRRAILEVQLLNRGVQSHKGMLTGMVINKGTVEATELKLQAFFEGSSSARFVLGRLLPNNKAFFEIPYSSPETAELLAGKLDLSGKSGKTEVSDVVDFSLKLGEASGAPLPSNPYDADYPGIFVFDPKTNTVKNSQFFGRSAETADMRNLVAGSSIEEFHSAVVYGVRRTGKSSLLDYFAAYVNGMHPDCLCFRIDVQRAEVSIHGVFINAVLQADDVVDALENCAERDIFLEKWQNERVENGQMDPRLIRSFFRELKKMTGKGLVLIIDEIDRLFKELEDHDKSALNELLRTISGILDDTKRRSFLQLVICGSNWLIRYRDVGYDDMQQMFQRFGDYQIRVGHLPQEDVLALLDSVHLNYAPGTKELIYEYTGGLVWFVKLLANAAIRRARDAKRSCVYPADVAFSLGSVVSEQNCLQFYEGCKVGTLERVMIDAMQSLAYRKDIYLHVEKLCDLVGKDPKEVKDALRRLIKFEIAEENPVNPTQVRFTLDIYRRFFRTAHSVFPVIPGESDVFEAEPLSSEPPAPADTEPKAGPLTEDIPEPTRTKTPEPSTEPANGPRIYQDSDEL